MVLAQGSSYYYTLAKELRISSADITQEAKVLAFATATEVVCQSEGKQENCCDGPDRRSSGHNYPLIVYAV